MLPSAATTGLYSKLDTADAISVDFRLPGAAGTSTDFRVDPKRCASNELPGLQSLGQHSFLQF